MIGYTQSENRTMIQIAEFTGIFGVTFLVLFVNQTIYQLFFRRGVKRPWRKKWPEGTLAIFLVSLVFLFGRQIQESEKLDNEKAKKIAVAIIQGNIDQSLKWNKDYQDEIIDNYINLTKLSLDSLQPTGGYSGNDADRNPPLVIWPETAAPFYFLSENRLTPRLFALTRETGAYLLFGSPASEQHASGNRYFNRAYLLSPEGRAAYYDKVHLVPFGEYVPLKKMLPFVNRMVESIGDFSSGGGGYSLSHPQAKIGVLICFETIFPELSRALKQDGGNLLVNITNDAWFGRTSAPYQHLSMLVFRAVENRTWVARSANTGFSAVIDSSGRIIQKSSLFEKNTIQAIIPLRPGGTFYSRYGDLLVYACWLVLGGGVIFFYFGRNRRK